MLTYVAGQTPAEFVERNYKELVRYSIWLLKQRGIIIRQPAAESMIATLYATKRLQHLVESFDPSRGTQISTYLRTGLLNSLLGVYRAFCEGESWSNGMTHLDAFVNGEGYLNSEVIGFDDTSFNESDTCIDLSQFFLKKKYPKYKMRILALLRIYSVPEIAKKRRCSRQAVYAILQQIRADFHKFMQSFT